MISNLAIMQQKIGRIPFSVILILALKPFDIHPPLHGNHRTIKLSHRKPKARPNARFPIRRKAFFSQHRSNIIDAAAEDGKQG